MLPAGLQQPLTAPPGSSARPRPCLRGRWIFLALCLALLLPARPQDVDEALKAALSGDLPRAESLLTPARDPRALMALGLVRQLQLRFDAAGALYQQAQSAFPAEAAFRLGNLDLEQQQAVQAAVRYRQALQADPSLLLARYNLAVATGSSPGPYPSAAGWCLVRYPLQTRLRFLELRSENLIQARWLAQGATTEEQLQQACEFTRQPDPGLWLARARVAPAGRRAVLVWRYLLTTLEPTGRECDLAVWGPGTIHGKASLTLGVLKDGAVVDAADDAGLGFRVPPLGHMLRIGPDGTARVYFAGDLPQAIGRLKIEGRGRLAVGYRLARSPAWDLVPESLLPYCLDCPYLTAQERRQRLEPLLEQPDLRLFALQELGNLALQEGDLAGAERLWRQALEVDPGWEVTAYNLAMVELLGHRYEAARAELDALQQRLPASRVAYQERLRLAVLLQNPYEALRLCQAYQQAFPHDPYPVYAAADILSEGERLEPALEIARSLVGDHPELAEPRYLLATLLGRSGQTRAQVEQLEWLLLHDPWPYRAQRMLADNLERMGVPERARELYREYLGSFWPILYEPTTYLEVDAHFSQDPISALVRKLGASHGLWLNGLSPNLGLGPEASPSQVVDKILSPVQVLEQRGVLIPDSGERPYTALLVETSQGRKVVLMQYQENIGWWTRVFDPTP